MKHVAGGSPIRSTFDGAGNKMPDFSPDGGRIVFRSSRDGGGVHEMRALGGNVRLIAKSGLSPRYSPSGFQIADWVGPASGASTVPGSGGVWVASVTGGQPRRTAAHLRTARCPVWSKDGTHLLLVGCTSARAFDSSGRGVSIESLDGLQATRSPCSIVADVNRSVISDGRRQPIASSSPLSKPPPICG